MTSKETRRPVRERQTIRSLECTKNIKTMSYFSKRMRKRVGRERKGEGSNPRLHKATTNFRFKTN